MSDYDSLYEKKKEFPKQILVYIAYILFLPLFALSLLFFGVRVVW